MINTSTAGNAGLSAAKRSQEERLTGSAAAMMGTEQTAPSRRSPNRKLRRLSRGSLFGRDIAALEELRERELRSNRKISDIDNEIARISEQNLVLVRLKSKGYVDSALYLSQMDEIDHKLRELRKLRRRLLEAAGEDRQIHDTERMMEYLEDGPEWLDEVPSDLFGELLDRIIIISPERLKFRLLNGMELSENIERMVR